MSRHCDQFDILTYCTCEDPAASAAAESLNLSFELLCACLGSFKTNIKPKIWGERNTLTWMRHLLTSLAHRALLQAKAREKLDRKRRNTDDEGCITTRTEFTRPTGAHEWERDRQRPRERERDAINKQLKHQRRAAATSKTNSVKVSSACYIPLTNKHRRAGNSHSLIHLVLERNHLKTRRESETPEVSLKHENTNSPPDCERAVNTIRCRSFKTWSDPSSRRPD